MDTSANSALRVRDTDRVDACALLDAARDDGQLTAGEHTRRTAAAMRARTFADIDAVIDDLQIPANLVDAPVVRPARRRRARRWVLAAAVPIAAALIGMLCGWAGSDDGPVAKKRVPDMTTPAGIVHFLAAYREHFGDLEVDSLDLHSANASIERRSTADPRKTERLFYDGKFRSSSTSNRDPETQPVDLGAVDQAKLAAILSGAPKTVGDPHASIAFITIERTSLAADNAPAVSIHTNGTGSRSGYLVISPAGEPMYVSKAGA